MRAGWYRNSDLKQHGVKQRNCSSHRVKEFKYLRRKSSSNLSEFSLDWNRWEETNKQPHMMILSHFPNHLFLFDLVKKSRKFGKTQTHIFAVSSIGGRPGESVQHHIRGRVLPRHPEAVRRDVAAPQVQRVWDRLYTHKYTLVSKTTADWTCNKR